MFTRYEIITMLLTSNVHVEDHNDMRSFFAALPDDELIPMLIIGYHGHWMDLIEPMGYGRYRFL